MKIRHMLLAVGLALGAATPAKADMPPIALLGVRIMLSTTVVVSDVFVSTVVRRGQVMDDVARLGKFETRLPGQTLEGYIFREVSAPALSTSTTYGIADVLPETRFQFWLESDLREVPHPWPMIVHPERFRSLIIESSIVKSVARRPAQFDGRVVALDNFFYVSPELARLLAKGPPVYTCRVYRGEMSDEQLVSYNPAIGENQMAALCAKGNPKSESRESLSDSEIDQFLNHGNTYVIGLPVD